MPLSEIEFLVLNNLADGPEPFSALYAETLRDLDAEHDVSVETLADAVEALVAGGLATRTDEGARAGGDLARHYARLDEELLDWLGDPDAGSPPDPSDDFAYSRGEWSYTLTATGLAEWERPEYSAFYPADADADEADAP